MALKNAAYETSPAACAGGFKACEVLAALLQARKVHGWEVVTVLYKTQTNFQVRSGNTILLRQICPFFVLFFFYFIYAVILMPLEYCGSCKQYLNVWDLLEKLTAEFTAVFDLFTLKNEPWHRDQTAAWLNKTTGMNKFPYKYCYEKLAVQKTWMSLFLRPRF